MAVSQSEAATDVVTDTTSEQPQPVVRFSLPDDAAPGPQAGEPPAAYRPTESSTAGVTAEEIRALSKALHGAPLQQRRMNVFQFEPISLPASRVPSHDDSRDSTRLPTPSSLAPHSPSLSPRIPTMQSPPLTPSGTDPTDSDVHDLPLRPAHAKAPLQHEVQPITPQATSSQDASPIRSAKGDGADATTSGGAETSTESPPRPQENHTHDDRERSTRSHRHGMFSVGPERTGPTSRDSSPSRLAAAAQFYSRPFAPGGEIDDPYAASKRPPQLKNPSKKSVEPRFQFSMKRRGSPGSSSTNLVPCEKRPPSLFSPPKGDDLLHAESHSSGHTRASSMADLKRFFKKGTHHHHHKSSKRDGSPSSIKSSIRTTAARSSYQPFGDDHSLTSKYGKFGKVLGSGAGGSVRLMKRNEDNTVFAVKEFRARHSYETDKEYTKKLTAEFCIGSTLHHGNVIETLDIVQERLKWYVVMEYAPYDLFAIVMTGKMAREEITCCFLQILNGVTYLHSMGLAHRDLKLDNVVVSAQGIMKIIDFGSAHVFKYPFESTIIKASGIVGSDPYLAPEVYDEQKYDPQAVDIWSLAIIYCCMTLRRFPWKVPRTTDNSFRLFAAEPTPGHDPKKLLLPSKSTADLSTTPAREWRPEGTDKDQSQSEHPATTHSAKAPEGTAASTSSAAHPEKKEIIRGPWRILRLLPRESRHIIGRMLVLNPAERATMGEILRERWVADTVICQQVGPGEVIPATDHTHVLEEPIPQPSK